MHNIKNLLAIALLAAVLVAFSVARADDGDTTKEFHPPVPGEKIDHGALVLNPTPHYLKTYRGKGLETKSLFSIKDATTETFSLQHLRTPEDKKAPFIKVKVKNGRSAPKRLHIASVPGAYRIQVKRRGIQITAWDSLGARYALRTLSQILDAARVSDGTLPRLDIRDYPDLPMRGVVEGFYGEPWSHEVRLSLIDFMGRHKMNTYVYGPKDDPYHRTPSWREPYPELEANRIAELVKRCSDNDIKFIWAIHPGGDIKWNEEDYGNILRKFGQMYDLGVRGFAIFFDDIRGEGTNPEKQAAWLNRLKGDFDARNLGVYPLILCPTDYSAAWADSTAKGALSVYGRELDPAYSIFWTGHAVMSNITDKTLRFVDSRIGRPALFWWNYPVTDYIRNKVLQGPCYGFDTDLTSDDLQGVTSNPMEHGEASKLAIYSVADYTWNVSGYNPIDSWERGLAELVPADPEAYRTFAIHSTDAIKGFRKAESWETPVEDFDPGAFTEEQYEALLADFRNMETVPGRMRQACPAPLLKELDPWLLEFGKLATRCRKALELAKLTKDGSPEEVEEGYRQNLMSEEDTNAYKAHISGTVKLQPFYERVMAYVAEKL